MTQFEQIPNITQYDNQFLFAKLDFLLHKSTFERKALQLQPSCQSPHAIELPSNQRAPLKEESIHAGANNSAKTIAINDSSNPTKNTEQNSSNLIASNQLDNKSEKVELIANFWSKSKNKTP